jgi:integrase
VASVVRRTGKTGPRWYVRYRDGNGKDVWRKCPSAKAARARKAEIELELARTGGTWTQPQRVTLHEYSERWLDEKAATLRAQTVRGYRRTFDRDWRPAFGEMPLAALTRPELKRYLAARAAGGASQNTIRNLIVPLRAMLNGAIEDGLVRENVALRLPLVGRPQRTTEPPTPAEVAAVLAAAGPVAGAPIALAAGSGLRRGEVFGLRWRDVDFDSQLIRVRSSNQDKHLVAPKTKAGERLVPMFGSVRRLLLEVRACSPYKRSEGFVFTTETGRLVDPDWWVYANFYPALRKAGVRFRFHDLRHYAVSQLIAQGANILQISRIAGHADPSITLRIYSHLMRDGLVEAALRYDPLPATAGLQVASRGKPLRAAP